MLINEQLVPTIESTDVLVTETDGADPVQVYRDCDGFYHVLRSGIARHPLCTPEDAMRALGVYLQSAMYKAESKVESTVVELRRMATPPDDGSIRGADLAKRMMQICGCKGQHDCDCVSVRNQAIRELSSEQNLRSAAA